MYTPCWLYSYDGRALYCVYVPVPMPQRLEYAALYFSWDGQHSQYRQERNPEAVRTTEAATAVFDLVDEARRPNEGAPTRRR